MCKMCLHVEPGTRVHLDRVVAKTDPESARHHLDQRRNRSGVLRELLALVEGETNHPKAVISIEGPAQGSFVGNLELVGNRRYELVGHGDSVEPAPK